MPFRERMKRAFRSGSSTGSTSPPSSSASKKDVYKPGEAPPPKYRRPPNKEHREKLEAFSFANAWRRKSTQSATGQLSPGHSRPSSRRASMLSRKSVVAPAAPSGPLLSPASAQARGEPQRGASQVGQVAEAPGDEGDTANVGGALSPQRSRSNRLNGRPAFHRASSSAPPPAGPADSGTGDGPADSVANGSVGGGGDDGGGVSTGGDKPFSQEELVLALKRSHLEVPAS